MAHSVSPKGKLPEKEKGNWGNFWRYLGFKREKKSSKMYFDQSVFIGMNIIRKWNF